MPPALFQEGLHGLLLIFGTKAQTEQRLVPVNGGVQPHLAAAIDGAFGQGNGTLTVAQYPMGQRIGSVHELFRLGHGVHQANGLRSLGTDGIASKNQLLSPGIPHQPWQPLGTATAGKNAQAHLWQAELGSERGHPQIAGHG